MKPRFCSPPGHSAGSLPIGATIPARHPKRRSACRSQEPTVVALVTRPLPLNAIWLPFTQPSLFNPRMRVLTFRNIGIGESSSLQTINGLSGYLQAYLPTEITASTTACLLTTKRYINVPQRCNRPPLRSVYANGPHHCDTTFSSGVSFRRTQGLHAFLLLFELIDSGDSQRWKWSKPRQPQSFQRNIEFCSAAVATFRLTLCAYIP